MEIFKKNLEEQGFSQKFIQKALEYFTELNEEMEVHEMEGLEEAIHYLDNYGTYTYNTLSTEENLKNFRKDILKLFNCDTNNILDFSKYFENTKEFEIQLIYVLYFEFYPL